jgi:hypothetical protein
MKGMIVRGFVRSMVFSPLAYLLPFCDADKTFGRSERTLTLERHDSFFINIASMLLKRTDRCHVLARYKRHHALWVNILPYWRNWRDEDTIGASSCIGQVQADSEIRSKQDPSELCLYRLTNCSAYNPQKMAPVRVLRLSHAQ